MNLLLRLLGLLGGLLMRAASVMLVLFVGHLLLSIWWPQMRDAALALDRLPQVRERVAELRASLSSQQATALMLKQQLDSVTESEVMRLQAELTDWQHRIGELSEERRRLQQQLEEMGQEKEEFCSSLNPFKRYLCGRVRERWERLSGRLKPALEKLAEDAATGSPANQPRYPAYTWREECLTVP